MHESYLFYFSDSGSIVFTLSSIQIPCCANSRSSAHWCNVESWCVKCSFLCTAHTRTRRLLRVPRPLEGASCIKICIDRTADLCSWVWPVIYNHYTLYNCPKLLSEVLFDFNFQQFDFFFTGICITVVLNFMAKWNWRIGVIILQVWSHLVVELEKRIWATGKK